MAMEGSIVKFINEKSQQGKSNLQVFRAMTGTLRIPLDLYVLKWLGLKA